MKTCHFRTYLRLQLKRSGRLLPAVLLVTLLLLAGVSLLAALIFDLDAAGGQKQRLNIGIVGDASDSYLNLGVYALQNLDSSRFSISFQRLELAQAQAGLADGSLNAYIDIPDDFVASMGRGENQTLTYVTTDGTLGIGHAIADEVVGCVSDLLLESQNAIFGMQRYGLAHGVQTDLYQAGDRLCQRYLEAILARETLYQLDVVGVSGQLSLAGYTLCGLSVLFLLLWGIGGSPLFVGRDASLCRVLRAKGLGTWAQVAGEYLAWLALMLTSLACVGAVAALFLARSGFTLPEWEGGAGHYALRFLLAMLPVAAMLSALQLLLYELVDGPIHSILLQFFSAVCLGYLSGCFYPIQFFPDCVQRLARFLPTGVGLAYLEGCLAGRQTLGAAAAVAAYLLIFLSGTVLVRARRTSR
jgi:hypothetical protein